MIELQNLLNGYIPSDEADAANLASFQEAIAVFGDKLLFRENILGHLTPSAWVVNKDRSKALLAYHNFMDCWAWLGGHADGNSNLAEAARKEVKEESGVEHIRLLSDKPIDVSVLIANAQCKKGKEIAAHLHFCPCYLFEADENDELQVCAGENKAVGWFGVAEIAAMTKNETDAKLYQRIMDKVRERNL